MIKAIIFDMNGVLVSNFAPEVYENYAHKFGLRLDEFKGILEEFFEWSITNKDKTVDEFWNTKSGDWGNITLENFKQFTADLHASEKLNDEVMNVAQRLKTKYKIGVLSNIGGVDPAGLFERKYGVKDFFDFAFNSGQFGIPKPALRIYEKMLREMNMEADEVVFVDDKIRNVEAAQEAGITAIHFSNFSMPIQELIQKLKKVGISFEG